MSVDLATVWAFIIAFAVFAYVCMDGFDLGIGILFPAFAVGGERDRVINSIAPVWDGNETWLVLGGGGLLAAFPPAYAILLPALYPPIIAMLLGLVFRGVAFEFRWRHAGHRRLWDIGFTIGSLTATLAQGIALGAILQGVKVRDDAYAGGWLDWLSPFSLLTGVALVIGYALLGATWIVWRTEGQARDRARSLAFWLGGGTLIAMGLVSAATPFLQFAYWKRWFAMPGLLLTAPVPIMVVLAGTAFYRALAKGADLAPFLIALGLFLLGFIGLGISIYPYIVPQAMTIWAASAPRESQIFILVGAAFIIPVILIYTAWAYWVFRGKIGEEGYH